jgi:hypothetical protein
MEKFGNKFDSFKDLTIDDKVKKVLDSEELEKMLKGDDVPYLAEKYLDDPLNGNMNKLRHSLPKRSVTGGRLKGKAKKKNKPIIGISTRKR